MPIAKDGIPITLWTVSCAVLSVCVLVGSVFQARSSTLFGPEHRRGTNWLTLAVGTFAAVYLFYLGLGVDNPKVTISYAPIDAVLQAIKTTGGNGVPQSLSTNLFEDLLKNWRGGVKDPTHVAEQACGAIYLYHYFLCILAPVSLVSALASRLAHFLALPTAWWRSLSRETYVFDGLSEPTLTLAESIRDPKVRTRRGKANLVFAEARKDEDDGFHVRAHDLGATCVQHPIDTIWRHLSHRRHIHIILSSKDEERNVTLASSIRKAGEAAAEEWKPPLPYRLPLVSQLSFARKAIADWESSPHLSVYAVTMLRGAEVMFEREADNGNANDQGRCKQVPVRCIDWTRNTVEKILGAYPLFLVGNQPDMPVGGGATDVRNRHLAWQDQMLDAGKRHVVVVGAGHVGMEFLRLALSTSRDCAPSGGKPLGYRFDVFDNRADVTDRGACVAERRFLAQTDDAYTLDDLDCQFHLNDALGQGFYDELLKLDRDKRYGGITYVLVALGDDFATAQVSMRIRELFRRRCDDAPVDSVARRTPPVVVAVLDEDELCDALGRAKHASFEYHIATMGAPKDMYTYDLVIGGASGKGGEARVESERDRRAARAKYLFRKYMLFAYARDGGDVRDLAVNWREAYGGTMAPGGGFDTSRAVAQFETLRRVLRSKAFADPSKGTGNWLVRMEGEREAVYVWAEGEGGLQQR